MGSILVSLEKRKLRGNEVYYLDTFPTRLWVIPSQFPESVFIPYGRDIYLDFPLWDAKIERIKNKYVLCPHKGWKTFYFTSDYDLSVVFPQNVEVLKFSYRRGNGAVISTQSKYVVVELKKDGIVSGVAVISVNNYVDHIIEF